MKEATLDITGYLRAGLRADPKLARNRFGLEEAINVVSSELGLEAYEDVTDPFAGGESGAYPFPQIFRNRSKTLLFHQTSIKTVTEGGSPWTLSSAITTYDSDEPETQKAITGNAVWHYVDLGSTWYAFNGTCVVFETGMEDLTGRSGKVFVNDSVSIQTGCLHNGRIIIGGFDPSNFWGVSLTELIQELRRDLPPDVEPSFNDMGQAYVLYSSPGASDFPLWLIYPDVYDYDVGVGKDRFISRARQNTFGWVPMPFQGPVYAIKPLGNSLIVYGADGIAVLQPYANEYASGYGVAESIRVGVYNRGAVGGDSARHVFIDTRGDVWSVTSQGFSRLGFGEWLLGELASTLRMSTDFTRGRVYISSSTGHVLSRDRLTEVTQRVPSLDFAEGGLLALADNSQEADADYIYITTNPIDMGYLGYKTLTSVQVGAESDYDIYVSCLFRYTKDDDWRQSTWFRTNDRGYSYLRVTAKEFKIRIKIEGKDGVNIPFAYITWQSPDKRHIRGFIQQPGFNEEAE